MKRIGLTALMIGLFFQMGCSSQTMKEMKRLKEEGETRKTEKSAKNISKFVPAISWRWIDSTPESDYNRL